MELITVPMKIPEGMAPFLEDESSEQRFQRNAMFLYSLIQDQRISYGRAAEILGVSKWSLIEFFNQMGVPYLNQTKSDLLEELRTYDRLKEQRA
jgi:predicted HTH domain antitoxin